MIKIFKHLNSLHVWTSAVKTIRRLMDELMMQNVEMSENCSDKYFQAFSVNFNFILMHIFQACQFFRRFEEGKNPMNLTWQ